LTSEPVTNILIGIHGGERTFAIQLSPLEQQTRGKTVFSGYVTYAHSRLLGFFNNYEVFRIRSASSTLNRCDHLNMVQSLRSTFYHRLTPGVYLALQSIRFKQGLLQEMDLDGIKDES
jgi:hypothetical protein